MRLFVVANPVSPLPQCLPPLSHTLCWVLYGSDILISCLGSRARDSGFGGAGQKRSVALQVVVVFGGGVNCRGSAVPLSRTDVG